MPHRDTFFEVPRLIASEYPVVGDTRCVSVQIPDDDTFLPVLAAMVAALGNNWAAIGTRQERADWAQMWQVAYAATDWDGCMSCDDVTDCIETNEGTQQAINNVYNQYGTGNPMPETTRTTNLGGTIIDCNPDELWGAVSELIESMNRNNIDAQEAIEVISNIAERIALIFAAIPLAETLPVDEAIEFVQSTWTDGLFEIYIANDTDGYRDELKCDLFCLARDNGCVLTLNMLYDYYADRVGYVGLDDFAALIAYVSTGVWVGTQVNDIFYLIQVAALRFGNQFFSITGLRPMEMYMALGANNPDPDWEILCTDCNNLCRAEYDFANQPDDLTVTIGTLDSFGFIKSALDTGTMYTAFTSDQAHAGDIRRVRLYFSDNRFKACQVFVDGAVYVVNGIPVESGGVWSLTAEIDMANDGTLDGVLARQDIGDTIEFYLMAVVVVYDC
jgi:hypothetical protein